MNGSLRFLRTGSAESSRLHAVSTGGAARTWIVNIATIPRLSCPNLERPSQRVSRPRKQTYFHVRNNLALATDIISYGPAGRFRTDSNINLFAGP